MDPNGFRPDLEPAYQKYVDRKWTAGLRARDRDDWARVAGRMQGWREYGNNFRDGMCEILGYTAERGWVKEQHYPNRELGARFHDTAHDDLDRVVEFKAGRVGRDSLRQLRKDEAALRRFMTVEWHVRDLSLVHKEVRKELERLTELYPETFTFREVPAKDAERALAIGKEMAKERECTKAINREIERLQPVLDRMPDLDARGRLLNTLEYAALLDPSKEAMRLALAQLGAEHQVMREETQERFELEQQLNDLTPRVPKRVQEVKRDAREFAGLEPQSQDLTPKPEHVEGLEQDEHGKELPPLEFNSAERRTALALHLQSLGVEPELIEVRMLCELAQAQPPVEAARMPIEGPTKMRPQRDGPHLERDRNRGQERRR